MQRQGRSKKLSKKWTGPYTIVEQHSPQVVVLKELNRNWFTINVKWFKCNPNYTQPV